MRALFAALIMGTTAVYADDVTEVIRKTDPLTDEERIFYFASHDTSAGEVAAMGFTCDREGPQLLVSPGGLHMFYDILVRVDYRVGDKPPVRGDVWWQNNDSNMSLLKSDKAPPVIKQIMEEKKFYIRFSDGSNALFQLPSRDPNLLEFAKACITFNPDFASLLSGSSLFSEE